jgi:capsular polysaccharide biosynthesis protein
MLFNKRGVALITIIIWIIIIGAIIIYAPRLYNRYVEQETIRIIKSNVESVENEIKSELMDKHPVLIWNDADKIIKSLSIQNPVTKELQTKNGWSSPGDVVVYFDGKDTFTLDGIGPNGNMLHLDIVIKK